MKQAETEKFAVTDMKLKWKKIMVKNETELKIFYNLNHTAARVVM